jgi:hypothetical protein
MLPRDDIKMDFKDIEFNWLRLRSTDGYCGFCNKIVHKIWKISSPAELLSVSEDRLCFMEIVTQPGN